MQKNVVVSSVWDTLLSKLTRNELSCLHRFQLDTHIFSLFWCSLWKSSACSNAILVVIVCIATLSSCGSSMVWRKWNNATTSKLKAFSNGTYRRWRSSRVKLDWKSRRNNITPITTPICSTSSFQRCKRWNKRWDAVFTPWDTRQAKLISLGRKEIVPYPFC